MKKSMINLPDGGKIIDMSDCLIVIDKAFAEKYIDKFGWLRLPGETATVTEPISCKASSFTTKKGRKAFRISEGDSHTFWTRPGSGDTSWNGWSDRRPVNTTYANAVRTSNGGGCWREVIVMDKGVEPVSAEQARYLDEANV